MWKKLLSKARDHSFPIIFSGLIMALTGAAPEEWCSRLAKLVGLPSRWNPRVVLITAGIVCVAIGSGIHFRKRALNARAPDRVPNSHQDRPPDRKKGSLNTESENPKPRNPIVRPSRCFGRDHQVALLIDSLIGRDSAALLVLGMAGMGKTTVTRQIATNEKVVAEFAERRWFVPLEIANDDSALQNSIVQACGFAPNATSFTDALLWLGRQKTLLVLDNLETPWDRKQQEVENLLQQLATTPNVSLLVSCRGLKAPKSPRWTTEPIILEALGEEDAKRIFLEVAPFIAANDPYLALFLTELGGWPLAVELVAQRAGGDPSLSELWQEWQIRGVALAENRDSGVLSRLTSLERSLDLSWRSSRLRDEGKRLFSLLGQLPAGMSDEDRKALLGSDAREASSQLQAIALASLDRGRIDLLPPVRDYARRTHPPQRADTTAWIKHYLALADRLSRKIGQPAGVEAAARLMPEAANIESALRAGAGGDARPLAVDAAFQFAEFCRFTGRRGSILGELAELCAKSGDSRGEARCLECHSDILRGRSDYTAARLGYDRARSIYQDIGEHDREAWCILCLADILLDHSEYGEAQEGYSKALSIYLRSGDARGVANCRLRLAELTLARSEYDAAQSKFEETMLCYSKIDSLLGETNCIKRLADTAFAQDKLDSARTGYERSLPKFQTIADLLGEASCIQGCGEVALASKRYRDAEKLYGKAHDSPHFLSPRSCADSRRFPTRSGNFVDECASWTSNRRNCAMADG